MEQNVFDVLKERGFIEQTTHEAEIRELLGKEKVTFYIGFDATADSLTAGHFLTIMAMMHMQRAGHRPIALLGGGTTMIGDPSGKSDMRNMMTKEKIDYNAKRFHEQLSRFIDFDNDKAIIANNADWLLDLNYVEFLREIGVHFSVNKMLTAECYKQRMERGLTFFEFNYMLMQSYDFLKLNQLYGCQMELGGNDQWSNILGGVDRPTSGKVFVDGQDVYAQNEDQLAIFRRRQVGLIYQFYNLIPVLNVVENMTLPVLMDGRQVNQERLEELLDVLGLRGREKYLPNQLSGGQQQRVSIGRALMNAPAVVLADEPTGNLDSKNSQEIVELLKMSNKKYGQTLVIITHDENIALQAHRVIAIEDGRITRDERIREVLE